METPSQKKLFDKKVVATLGILCIVLLAGLVSTLAFYMPMVNSLNSQIAEKDNTISSLNSQITQKDNEISSLNSQILNLQNTLASRDSRISSLNLTVYALYEYLYLKVSTLLVYNEVSQEAGSQTVIWLDAMPYAGYVAVSVKSSSNTTYVEASYSYKEVFYHNRVVVGTNGTAAFPVLPTLLEIIVGNTDAGSPITATVMAVYYY